MFNIQKAVSRLDYAPKLKEIKVTNIKKGIGVFTPLSDKPISFAALKGTLKKAGYTLDSADITVIGKLDREEKAMFLIAEVSGQKFTIEASDLEQTLTGLDVGNILEITGGWKTVDAGVSSREVITARTAKEVVAGTSANAAAYFSFERFSAVRFVSAKFAGPELEDFDGLSKGTHAQPRNGRDLVAPNGHSEGEMHHYTWPELRAAGARYAAPIRVTSPGLTVYKGGALTPRLYFIKQHLGSLEVKRQVLDVSLSYTPSPRVQLEVEVPFSRTSFDDNITSGSEVAFGNITVWSKYRFFRKVKTYGDRQAAARFGLELPTGKKDALSAAQLAAPAFVRQQLTSISGGLSPHFDVAFSQAGGRFIFGGNAEGILRTGRDGFRMGHEVLVSTDTEYVLLPRKYDVPGGELFVIMETTFVHKGIGRLDGLPVSGSNSTEYYIAPGLQYAAAPQFVLEASIQLPVIRNTGPMVLRNDRNILVGVRYLF